VAIDLFQRVTIPTPYAGIGSRETPPDILDLMTAIAVELRDRGYILRSGGAPGADSAFSKLIGFREKEIILPWKNFEGIREGIDATSQPNFPEALRIAESYHPAWDRCSEGARKMHARNVYQILGLNLNNPVVFVVCWTKNGRAVGGTGQALRIASDPAYAIPIYNLHDAKTRGLFYGMLEWK